MASPLPAISGKEAVRAFERLGYSVDRQRGSHVRLKAEGRKSLSIPVHSGQDLKPGTLRSLIRDSGFTVEEFREAL